MLPIKIKFHGHEIFLSSVFLRVTSAFFSVSAAFFVFLLAVFFLLACFTVPFMVAKSK